MLPHDTEFVELKERLLLMASRAESALTRSLKALVDRDDDLARAVIEDDSALDRLEEIDDLAIHLLSKAPLANDLRLILIATKISRDLERVGDEATTISRRSIELSTEPQLKPYIDIPRMAELTLQMLRDGVDSFIHGNTEKARAVIPRDKEVDLINKQLHRELASYMIERPATISRCLNLMVISKALERMADHAKNLAEEVVYVYEARDIRHTAVARPDAGATG